MGQVSEYYFPEENLDGLCAHEKVPYGSLEKRTSALQRPTLY